MTTDVKVGIVILSLLTLVTLLGLGLRAFDRRDDYARCEREALDVAAIARNRRLWCELIPWHGQWRWLIWDAEASEDQVDGMLVPYVMGSAPTRDQARHLAHQATLHDIDFPCRIVRFVDGTLR